MPADGIPSLFSDSRRSLRTETETFVLGSQHMIRHNHRLLVERSAPATRALEALRQRKRVLNRELLHYARMLRVEKPKSPYLQAIE